MRIREGDPLEIFVSNEGEVIFKKYSPISELGSIAAQYCEVLECRVSHGLEDQIENRRSFSAGDGQPLQPIEGVSYYALVQSPIISSGDVCGSVMFLQNKESDRPGAPSRSSFRRWRAISGNRWSCNGYRCALRSIDRRAMYCGAI